MLVTGQTLLLGLGEHLLVVYPNRASRGPLSEQLVGLNKKSSYQTAVDVLKSSAPVDPNLP
jgi:hypothetical protein